MATDAVPVTLVSPSQLAAERTLVKPSSRGLEEGIAWLGAECSPKLFQPCFVCCIILSLILALWSAEGKG